MDDIDNYTAFAVIDELAQSTHYRTFYGACLSYCRGKWKWLKLRWHLTSHGAKQRHGTRKYWLYNVSNSPKHNQIWSRGQAEAFAEPGRPDQIQVDHIDGNPDNNRGDNVRWCTGKENIQFAREIRRGERVITNLQKSLFYVNYSTDN